MRKIFRKTSVFYPLIRCPHIETSQLICTANQLTGFYMRATHQAVKNVSFSENFAYLLNEWAPFYSAIKYLIRIVWRKIQHFAWKRSLRKRVNRICLAFAECNILLETILPLSQVSVKRVKLQKYGVSEWKYVNMRQTSKMTNVIIWVQNSRFKCNSRVVFRTQSNNCDRFFPKLVNG